MNNHPKLFSIFFITAILVASLLSISSVNSLVPTDKIRIMPLGDSITVGYPASINGYEGYRRNLFQGLEALGYKVDFVGSQKNGTGFDVDNEGHLSYEANQIRDYIYGWLNENPADIILLHIGTNDVQNQDANGIVAEVSSILDNIDRWEIDRSTNVTVILARIILRSDNQTWNNITKEYNTALGAMANTRIAKGDRILLTDMQNVLNYTTDLVDGVHPTSIGYQKMAEAWRSEITKLIGFSLTVNYSQHGSIIVSPNQTSYSPSSIVNLFAQPENGWAFNGWVGDLNSSVNPVNIIMDRNKQFTANFTQAQYKLTILATDGATTPPIGEYWYPAGTQITINASSPINGQNERYSWLGWNGTGLGSYSGQNNQTIITMNGNITQTANWKHELKLSISNNIGSTTPAADQWYEAGSLVNIMSEPPSASTGTQYVCTGWVGTGSAPASGSTSSTAFTISAPSSITWMWKTQYYLTVSSSHGSPGGTGWYDSGSTAYASVSPTTVTENGVQYTFSEWGGSVSSTSPSASILMDGPKTVTANWRTIPINTPTKTPTPTPTSTLTPTKNPSPTANATSISSQTPKTTPSSSSSQFPFDIKNYFNYIIVIIVIVLAIVIISAAALRKTKK